MDQTVSDIGRDEANSIHVADIAISSQVVTKGVRRGESYSLTKFRYYSS